MADKKPKSKKYKILPIKHLLKGNKIAKAGDIVDGSQFINLQSSLDEGYCVEVKSGEQESPEGSENVDLTKLTKAQLLEYAEKNEIELSEEDKKKTKAEILNAIVEQV